MNAPQHKAAIKDALNRFTTGDLVQNARNLLNTLGYRSERTLTLESSTAETFIAAYDSQGKLNRDRALTAKWTSIDLLFQLRGTDLTPPDTTEWLFDPSQAQVDNTIIESYLFFAIRLEGNNYSPHPTVADYPRNQQIVHDARDAALSARRDTHLVDYQSPSARIRPLPRCP